MASQRRCFDQLVESCRLIICGFQVTATTITSAMLTVEETLGIGNVSPRMKAEVHL